MLKRFFKLAVFGGVVYGLFVIVYLQEVTFGGGFEKDCADAGIILPLDEPRIEVDVSNYTMSLYDGERMVRRYDIAVGENRRLGILTKDAESTPLGEYRITRKAIREDIFRRGSRFFEIDFPSLEDIESAYEVGLIDAENYARCHRAFLAGDPLPNDLPIGDTLGIQGNHSVLAGNRSTDGSIALRNADINQIFEHIPVGTPVIIRQ